MTSRFFLQKQILVLVSLFIIHASFAQQKPNIIIIYADDVGYGDLSCYGMTSIQTPHIDGLAAEGLKFTDAHSTSATCTPSRYGILMGKYPWRQKGTGVAPGDASLIIPRDKGTMPAALQKAGYQTAVIGKWHLGLGNGETINWNGDIRPGPNEVGFNYAFIMPATLDRVPCVYVEDHHVVNLDQQDPIEVNYQHKIGNEPTGKENPEMLRMKPDPQQGHNQTIVDSISRIGWMSGGHSARWRDEDIAGTITKKAIQFIGKNKQQPFFLYFATGDIHVPRYPHSMFRGKSGMGLRGDAILQLDYTVGQIMHTLDSLHLAENTLVIFSSDNGPVVNDGYLDGSVEHLGDHRPGGLLRGGKYSIFEAGTRVPFIVKWPGQVKAGKTTNALFSQVDLYASLARLTGQKLSNGDGQDSFDRLDVLLGKSHENRPFLVEDARGLSITRGPWKYIVPNSGAAYDKAVNIELGNLPQPQLYNMRNDISEQHNVADKHPDVVKELAALLDKIKENIP